MFLDILSPIRAKVEHNPALDWSEFSIDTGILPVQNKRNQMHILNTLLK